MVQKEVMPLAHATLANVRATLSQRLTAGDLSNFLQLGSRLNAVEASHSGMCLSWHVPWLCVSFCVDHDRHACLTTASMPHCM